MANVHLKLKEHFFYHIYQLLDIMHIVLLIQSRCNASEIPYKIVKPLTKDKTMIEHIIERCLKSKLANQIIINTTTNFSDEKLVNVIRHNNWNNILSVYRGSETNVLERTCQIASMTRADIIVRVKANRPFIDPDILDTVIQHFIETKYDYMFLSKAGLFPDGFDFDIFDVGTLHKIMKYTSNPNDLKRIDSFIFDNPKHFHFYQYNLSNPNSLDFNVTDYPNIDFTKLRLSVQTLSDWEYVKRLFTTVYSSNPNFRLKDVLQFLNKHPNLIEYKQPEPKISKKTLFYGKGQRLLITAKRIIPNGVQDLTKLPESSAPEIHPSYYTRASNIEITTLNGYKLLDFSTMASGNCIMGYRDPDIDAAVHDSIERGNLSSLNNPNEIKLAEMLVELHPWASFAKFSKSESNGLSMAVKIARYYTNKSKIIIIGNSSWHDNFMAANLNPIEMQVDGSSYYKYADLSTKGVLPEMADSAINVTNYDDINKIIKKEHTKISAVLMEPATDRPMPINVYENIRELCSKHNILIIVNETRFGFRANTGGLHLMYDIEPDLAVFGSSMSNGFGISTVIGKRKLMKFAQNIYATETTWCDDIGINAAIETINKHKEKNVGKHIRSIGRYFQEKLHRLSMKHNIPIKINGIPSLTQFDFNYSIVKENINYTEYGEGGPYRFGNLNNLLRTLYIQLMLERQILADTFFYPSYAHTFKHVDYYLKHISEVFKEIKSLLENKKVYERLVSEPAFKSYQKTV
jgi:glutamate-1-semialdehyde 2,1-aminomutase